MRLSHRRRHSTAADAPPRPRDPWVFRSALDGHARMLTVALSDKLYITYDTQHATLARAWHDGVNFTGGVYDARHGPQPTSLGKPYFKAPNETAAWTVQQDGKPVDAKVHYLGYRMNGDSVAIDFAIHTPIGRVKISEVPEVVREGDGITLSRAFTVDGLPTGTTLDLSLAGSDGDAVVEYNVQVPAATPAGKLVATPTTQPTSQPTSLLRITNNGLVRLFTKWGQA
ncbi:MAG: hypothetical protein QM754_00365 [Tepidisphaeraceae bacterium]